MLVFMRRGNEKRGERVKRLNGSVREGEKRAEIEKKKEKGRERRRER